MGKVEITLKSGQLVVADVDEFVIQRNALGGLRGVKWTTPANAERTLMQVDVDEISSIVFIDKENADEQHEETTQATTA